MKEAADIFNQDNKIKPHYFKWGKVGNFISGTLLSVREMESNFADKKGQMVKQYEIKVSGGRFNDLDESKNPKDPAIDLLPGEIWTVSGKDSIDEQMRRVLIGQKVGMKFEELRPNKQKGYNPVKAIGIYTTGEMDKEWLEGGGATEGVPFNG